MKTYKGNGNICLVMKTGRTNILYENAQDITYGVDKRNKFSVQLTKNSGDKHYFGPECELLAIWTTD